MSIETTDTGLQATIDALSSPIRREILWMLWNDDLVAGDIAAAFDLALPTISGHLKALREAGLVSVEVDGNFRRYRAERGAVTALVPLLQHGDRPWGPVRTMPEQELATVSHGSLVSVAVEVAATRSEAFDAFTDEEQYSRWLGAPVRIQDGRFTATMEWGARVRGNYEVVVRPELIAMRWDLDEQAVPVPGRQVVGYLRFTAVGRHGRATKVEVQQHASTDADADFLGRGVVDGAGPVPVLGGLRRRRPRARPATTDRRRSSGQ